MFHNINWRKIFRNANQWLNNLIVLFNCHAIYGVDYCAESLRNSLPSFCPKPQKEAKTLFAAESACSTRKQLAS
jgi:hypothetical protein